MSTLKFAFVVFLTAIVAFEPALAIESHALRRIKETRRQKSLQAQQEAFVEKILSMKSDEELVDHLSTSYAKLAEAVQAHPQKFLKGLARRGKVSKALNEQFANDEQAAQLLGYVQGDTLEANLSRVFSNEAVVAYREGLRKQLAEKGGLESLQNQLEVAKMKRNSKVNRMPALEIEKCNFSGLDSFLVFCGLGLVALPFRLAVGFVALVLEIILIPIVYFIVN